MKYYKSRNETLYAYIFGISFFLFLLLTIVSIFVNSNGVVLGTEMNADGTIEYLCLGTDCENIFR